MKKKIIILISFLSASGISFFSWKEISKDNPQPIVQQKKKDERYEKEEKSQEIIQDDYQESNHFFFWIIIGIIVLIGIGIIFYFLKKKRVNNNNNNEEIKSNLSNDSLNIDYQEANHILKINPHENKTKADPDFLKAEPLKTKQPQNDNFQPPSPEVNPEIKLPKFKKKDNVLETKVDHDLECKIIIDGSQMRLILHNTFFPEDFAEKIIKLDISDNPRCKHQ